MNLSPLSAESEDNLKTLYRSIESKYLIFNSINSFLGLKSLNLNSEIIEPKSSYILEVEFGCMSIIEFIKAYSEHYMWFKSSPIERITLGDRTESAYCKVWALLDNFFEDAARQYQRLFNLNSLFGMFEVIDVCSNSLGLSSVLSDTLENYKIVCLANFSSSSITNCFVSYPEIELKPNFVYLFPSSFTHKINFSASEDNLFVFVGGFA
jgi:hypothetical protein